MRCVYCLKRKTYRLTWSNLFTGEPLVALCSKCSMALEHIKGTRCKRCSRQTEAVLCQDCLKWEEKGDCLNGNTSVFAYNEKIKEMIYQWKYRGDYEVGFAFKTAFRKHFHQLRGHFDKHAVLVPIPLSEERIAERGFNQAAMLASFLSGEVKEVLIREHGEKQSKKTRQERINVNNPFCLKENIQKPVILVDDIYTTGATLRHAAAVLKSGGAPSVKGYTLIRS